MAFDFLGTFNKSQMDRFLAFARAQVPFIPSRVAHLSAELNRIGTVTFTYTQGVPTQFAASPDTSYLAKLVAAYEVQGGDPFHDLRVRAKNDPVYASRGTETGPVQYMSNGEVIGARGLADAVSAELMRQGKTWLADILSYRFNSLERKIRRMMYYADELQSEIDYLTALKAAATVEGSFESIVSQITQLFTDTNYRAIFDDGGTDPFGLTTHAPFASYDAVPSGDPNVPNRSTDTAQRQNTGVVAPGGIGTETITTGDAETAVDALLGVPTP